MIFSATEGERHAKAVETLHYCINGQSSRQNFYRSCRTAFLFGSEHGTQSKAKKIEPIVRRRASFLYAPESVSFWINLSPEEMTGPNAGRIESAIDAINDQWHYSGLDLNVKEAVKWGLVYGTSILMVMPREHIMDARGKQQNSICSYWVDPGNFSVWREDVPDIDDQEAVVMTTYLMEPDMDRLLDGHPRGGWIKDRLLSSIEMGNISAKGQGRVFVTNASATNISGIAPANFTGQWGYEPDSQQPVFKLHEMYCWDDKEGDYKLFRISGDVVIHEEKLSNLGVSGRLPFVKICPSPMPNYFWGESLVNDLAPLQEWFLDRMEKMDELFLKQLSPPKFVKGFTQQAAEKMSALNRPGGMAFGGGAMNADVQSFAPAVSESSFQMLEMIDSLFEEMSGMRAAMMGKQEGGVRSEGIAASMMRVSGAEIRLEALVIERQIEEAANLMFQLMREYDDMLLPEVGMTGDYTKEKFILAEFPSDARIIVDGHSASPLAVEDHTALAQGLFKSGAIDQETLIDIVHPPMKGLMKSRLRRQLFAKLVAAEMHKIQMQQKQMGTAGSAAHAKG